MKKVFDEVMTEKVSDLKKEIDTQVQEAQSLK